MPLTTPKVDCPAPGSPARAPTRCRWCDASCRTPAIFVLPTQMLTQDCENGTYPDTDRTLTEDNTRLRVLDPQACSLCQTVTISALTRTDSPYGFKHHSSQHELLRSADRGCRLCLWVCYALPLDTNHPRFTHPIRPFGI
jgi:hypothetical protein